MFEHMLKLIWNRKKSNAFIMFSMAISFFVLFVALTVLLYQIENYTLPLGFSYENIWAINLDCKGQSPSTIANMLQQITAYVSSIPEIRNHSYCFAFLFTPASIRTTVSFEEQEHNTEWLMADDSFANVLGVTVLEGRWFNESDEGASIPGLVVNKFFQEQIFGNHVSIGKKVLIGDEEYRIIGLIDDFKNTGDLTGSKVLAFNRFSIHDEKIMKDMARDSHYRLLLKMAPDVTAQFEKPLIHALQTLAPDWSFTLNTMASLRKSALNFSLMLPAILVGICLFLITNVALGFFGMVYYQMNQRKSEIGLRRAMGASRQQILLQVTGESLVMTLFSVVLGSFVAIQIPMLGVFDFVATGIYALALFLSCLFLLGLSFLCSIFPAYRATTVQPADVLHCE